MNLLEETKHKIKLHGKKISDIVFIGIPGAGSCSWRKFAELADKEYDNSYGSVEVNEYLKIVFSDGSWLERDEYDGSEWWSFRKTPGITEVSATLTSADIFK